MKKKVLAGILAATMVFSMAACGSTGSDSDSGSSAASGSTAKTEEKGEPYTVTMVLQGSQQQDEERIEEKINEILEPELNAKLDIVVLPWASASQQLQLMLSGDEKIDLLYTNATTAVQYMHSGQIMDMSELIDKYGTNLKDIYGEDIAKTNQITKKSLAFIAGGETVVHLTGSGLGGRNQELALAAAEKISGLKEVAVFSVGSDGTDGPTDAAGGFVDGETKKKLADAGYRIEQVLEENDSYHALEKCDGLIKTGATGTNVNDVAVVLIRR